MFYPTSAATDQTFGQKCRLAWQRLAYQHKKAETLLYLMFLSGVLLWPAISVPWQVERWVLLTHMIAGLTVFPAYVGSFWFAHRKLLQQSKKPLLRKTGTLIEYLLVLCTLSGIYLTFWGNTGNNLSLLIRDIHFYSSWLLALLVVKHAWRWTVIRFFRKQ